MQRGQEYWTGPRQDRSAPRCDLLHREPHHLDLELSGDYARATLRDTDEPLPRIPPGRIDLILRGSNLTDEEARNHASFLKDLAPLPGRDVWLSVRVAF